MGISEQSLPILEIFLSLTAKGAVFVLWSGRNRLSLLLIRKANSTTHAPEWFVLKIMTCELFLCSTAEVKSMVYVKHSALYFTCIFGYRYEELCIVLVEQVPSLQENNKINVSDGLFLPDDKIALYFPASSHLDDAYHMVNINCVKHCPANEALSMKPLVWKMVKTYDELQFYECLDSLQTVCPTFYSRYSNANKL